MVRKAEMHFIQQFSQPEQQNQMLSKELSENKTIWIKNEFKL